jgi:hypothetical protein
MRPAPDPRRPLRPSRTALLALATSAAFAFAGCGPEPEPDPENRPPVADAGADLEVFVGDPVEITGSGTDPDGDEITFAWTLESRPDGSEAALEGADRATVSFTPDVEGAYVLGLVVNDGELDSDKDTVQVTAVTPEFISGHVTVRVVDHATGGAIEGAAVRVGDDLSGTTDVEGMVVLSEAGLEGPVDVEISHDATLEGPAGEPIPRWRGATVMGAVRSEITVPLRATWAPPPPATGRVAGHISYTLYEELPWVGPLLSFDRRPCSDVEDFENDWEDCDPEQLEEVASGQIRAVVVAPLIQRSPLEIEVSDLLAPPASAESSLPGNLTTDDGFLAGVSGLLGVPAAPDGGNGLTWFDMELPAGPQTLFVLGALISIDTHSLVPLLAGDAADPGAILGTMTLDSLYVGLIEVNVPAGDTLILEDDLGLDDLDEIYRPGATVTFHQAMESDPFSPEHEAQKRWAEVAFERTATVSAQGLLDDPRVEANVPEQVWVRVGEDWVLLDVPDDTGEPDTHVPYGLVVPLARTDLGLMPLGLAFTRAGAISREQATFGLPPATGLFADATLDAVGLTARGVGPYGEGGAYVMLPGQAVAQTALSTTSPSPLEDPLPFPTIVDPEDAGLEVRLVLDRPDPTTADVEGAAAQLIRLSEPDPAEHVLGETLEVQMPSGAHLAHVILSQRVAGPDDRIFEIPVWDVYADADAQMQLPVPAAAPLEGALRVDARAALWSSPFDMARWSGERLRQGPRTYTEDTWLVVRPD